MRGHSFFHVAFNRFNHHYRIIHHQPDCQDQTKHRKRINGKAEHREEHECSDERNRNCAQRNDGSPPALEKDEHDQENEQQRLPERAEDFVHSLADGESRVQRNDVREIGGKTLREFVQCLAHGVRSVERV